MCSLYLRTIINRVTALCSDGVSAGHIFVARVRVLPRSESDCTQRVRTRFCERDFANEIFLQAHSYLALRFPFRCEERRFNSDDSVRPCNTLRRDGLDLIVVAIELFNDSPAHFLWVFAPARQKTR